MSHASLYKYVVGLKAYTLEVSTAENVLFSLERSYTSLQP